MMKLLKISLFAFLISFATNSFAADPYKIITADELIQMKKDNKELVIIDSRSGDWFDGVMIEGATQLGAADTNAETLAKLAPKKDQAIVFYCQNLDCPASAKAAHKAAELGYTNLFKYPEGIEAWKKLGLPTSGEAKPKS
jgi:rhodanese-related sulfurtransferase